MSFWKCFLFLAFILLFLLQVKQKIIIQASGFIWAWKFIPDWNKNSHNSNNPLVDFLVPFCMEVQYIDDKRFESTKWFTQSVGQHLWAHRHGFVRAELYLCGKGDRIGRDDLSTQEELYNYIWASDRDSHADNNKSCLRSFWQSERPEHKLRAEPQLFNLTYKRRFILLGP